MGLKGFNIGKHIGYPNWASNGYAVSVEASLGLEALQLWAESITSVHISACHEEKGLDVFQTLLWARMVLPGYWLA